MSETITAPAETPQPSLPLETPQQAPEATPEPAPAPDADAAPAEQTEEQKAEKAEAAKAREDRRIAQLTAKLSAKQRESERQATELEFYRRQIAQQAPAQDTPEQRMARIEAEAEARAEAKLLARRFHEEGNAQFPDWQKKCQDLLSMGADAGFAAVLIDMPGGARVAAALAEDPEAVERIANIRSERGRAVALGKYAASVEGAQRTSPASAPAVPPVTRAPAPIRPVTGRASPVFNEYTADAQTLVDHFMKQNLERQRR